MEYLNFAELSKVPFKSLLDHLNVLYNETKTELKGEGFIVNKEKNLFFNPTGEGKGSVINFLSAHKGISLRDAAAEIKQQFFAPPEAKKLPDYDLNFEKAGFPPEVAKELEFGYCK